MPVYGDMLSFFPELLSCYEVYSMKPKISGGYEKREVIKTVKGYISFYNRGDMSIEGDLRTSNEMGTFWVIEDSDDKALPQGSYLEYDNETFVIFHDDNYRREGGFREYKFKRVAAVTDKQHPNKDVKEVILSDYE
jgi:hypothetical protein